MENDKFYIAYNYDYEGNTDVNYFRDKDKAQDFCDKYNLNLGTCCFNDNIQEKINNKIMFRIEINENENKEDIYVEDKKELSYYTLSEFCQIKHEDRANGYHSFYIFADNRREALKKAHNELNKTSSNIENKENK